MRPVVAWLRHFLGFSGFVGYCFMPDTSGRTLGQIESERTYARGRRERASAHRRPAQRRGMVMPPSTRITCPVE